MKVLRADGSRCTREEFLNMISSVDSAGDNFETRFRRKDGSMLDVEISTNGATLLSRADDAMYQAKERGRNQTVVMDQ